MYLSVTCFYNTVYIIYCCNFIGCLYFALSEVVENNASVIRYRFMFDNLKLHERKILTYFHFSWRSNACITFSFSLKAIFDFFVLDILLDTIPSIVLFHHGCKHT